MAAPQEVSNAIIDVVVDQPMSKHSRPIAEIIRPASQNHIEAISYFRPGGYIARTQVVCHFLAQPSQTLLRRPRSRIPPACLAKALRPKRVPQKVEALRVSLLDAGLCFVQGELDPLHHTTRPIQRLCRASATEDHKIVGIRDHSGSKHLTPSGDPPVLQKTVHVEVCQQRTNDS